MIGMTGLVHCSRKIFCFGIRAPVLQPLELDLITAEIQTEARESGHLSEVVRQDEEVDAESVYPTERTHIGNKLEITADQVEIRATILAIRLG